MTRRNALTKTGIESSADLEDEMPDEIGSDSPSSKKRKTTADDDEEIVLTPNIAKKGVKVSAKRSALVKAKKSIDSKKMKQDESGANIDTHQNLTKRGKKIGQTIRTILDNPENEFDGSLIDQLISDISKITGVRTDIREELFGDAKTFVKGKGAYSLFKNRYRDIFDADEIFSTSTVADILLGMLPKMADEEVMVRVMQLLTLVSVVRVPTEYVGAATKDFRMQHPSSVFSGTHGPQVPGGPSREISKKGMFGAPIGDPVEPGFETELTEHSVRDRVRKQTVVEMMERAVALKQSPERMIIDGLRGGIVATLDYMMSSSSASNVRSSLFAVSEQDIDDQNGWREDMKKIFNILSAAVGEPTISGVQDSDAVWFGASRWIGSSIDKLNRAPSALRATPVNVADPKEDRSIDLSDLGDESLEIDSHLAKMPPVMSEMLPL